MTNFTRLPNYILEEIYQGDFTKRQIKILIFLSRLTYGFHKSEAIVSQSDFRVCGVGRTAIKNELQKLESMDIIRILDSKSDLIKINPIVMDWKVKKVKVLYLIPRLGTRILSKQYKIVPNLRRHSFKRTNNGNDFGSLKDIKEILKEI